MKSVFIVHHVHVIGGEHADDVKLIGVYRSRQSAEEVIQRLVIQPGFLRFSRRLSDQ